MSDYSKNYPDSKKDEDDAREFEDVYAGPADMGNGPREVHDDPGMRCVYAGPGMFDRVNPAEKAPQKKPKKSWWPFRKRQEICGGVYAGPRMIKRSGFEKVYAGPPVKQEDDGDPNEFEDVYAGPEFFEKRGREDDPSEFEAVYAGPEMFGENDPETNEPEAEEPEAEEPDEPKPVPEQFKCVYAGPPADPRMFNGVYAGPPLDNRQFMAVYAGPVQMARGKGEDSMGMSNAFSGEHFSAGAPAQSADQINPNRKKCEKCGAFMPNDYKFCGYCGEQFTRQKFCPSCGAVVEENRKFCKECGTVLK